MLKVCLKLVEVRCTFVDTVPSIELLVCLNSLCAR